MGRLQSHVINTSIAAPAVGNIGNVGKLSRFALDHTGALRCCLESLYHAHELGVLEDVSAVQCSECSRCWTQTAGWWAVGVRRRPERFQSGQEASRERVEKAMKRGASPRSIMAAQAKQRKAKR